jgi:hypothetical protein
MSVSAVKPSVRSTWSVESPQVAVAHMNGRNGYEDSNEETIAFETENFDAKGFVDAKFQSMTEKGIRKLCDELTDLKKASAEEMRKAIYANYDAFIRLDASSFFLILLLSINPFHSQARVITSSSWRDLDNVHNL